MAHSAGEAFLTITPSFKGAIVAIDREVAKWGTQAGDTFSETFKETVKRQTDDTKVGPSDTETTKKGESAGGKFADSFKARVAAALRSLPDATVELNDEVAKLKLDEIRARLETLRNVNIGVDIKDVDALAAIEVLQVDLSELAVRSPNIRVHVDAAAAIAELEAVKIAADEASGEKAGAGAASGGIGGLAGAVGDLASAGPIVLGALALLSTALIPIGALAAGAALGLAGMIVAATAGIGAFGLAVLPVVMQVSKAMQQISSDQDAVNRATSQSQKNTAITHLQDDLNNLSPVARTVTLGLLNAKQLLSDWSSQFSPDIIKVFNAALADLGPFLQAITPLVHAGADALTGFFHAIGDAIKGPEFKKFMDWLAKETGPAIASFTSTFIKFGAGFAHLLENSGPLIKKVEEFLPKMADAFDKFVTSKTFKDFIDWIIKNGPGIFDDIKTIVKAIGELIVNLAPIGLMVLHLIADVVGAFTSLQEGLKEVWTWIWQNVLSPLIDGISKGLGGAIDALKVAWDTIWGGLKAAVSQAWQDIQPIIGTIKSAIDDVKSGWEWLTGHATYTTGGKPGTPTKDFIPGPSIIPPAPAHNAAGTGMGTFQGMSWVGERGPELVNFGKPVQIIPNHDLAGLGAGPGKSKAPLIGTAHFHNEADIDVMTRKADFAFRAGVL